MFIIRSLRGRGRRIAVGLRWVQLKAFSHNNHTGLEDDSVRKEHAVRDQESGFGPVKEDRIASGCISCITLEGWSHKTQKHMAS